jgi:hypothetical protein
MYAGIRAGLDGLYVDGGSNPLKGFEVDHRTVPV